MDGERKEFFEAGEQTPKSNPFAHAVTKKRRGRRPLTGVQLLILHLILAVLALWLMFGFIFGITTAPTNDMHPRIDNGDLLLFFRLETSPIAGDVVVFNKNNTQYVGRVVAVGGDTVEVTKDEQLKINGNTVVENDIYYSTPLYEGFVKYPLTLGEDSYFILVDSRSGGEDSRYFGPVVRSELLGTVITVVRRTNL